MSKLNLKRKSAFFKYATTFVGMIAGFGLITYLSNAEGVPVLFAPLAASACLIFSLPQGAYAQPRNVILGHFASALVGSVAFRLLGDHWFAIALCAGTAVLVMDVTRTMHPPAAATSIIALLTQQPLSFAFIPVGLGSLILVATGVVIHRVLQDGEYPRPKRTLRLK